MITQTQTVGSYLALKIAIKSNNSYVAWKKREKIDTAIDLKELLDFQSTTQKHLELEPYLFTKFKNRVCQISQSS